MKFFRLPKKFKKRDIDYIIKQIIWVFQNEKTVVLPTDTYYALSGDAKSDQVVRAIKEIKSRREDKPFPVLIKDFAQAERLAHFSLRFRFFLWQAWPGKLTVVMPLRPGVSLPRGVVSKEGKVGMRADGHAFIEALFETYGGPLVGTSANRTGLPPSRTVEHFLNQLTTYDRKPDVIVDVGELPESKPSTVVELDNDKKPRILRHGAVSQKDIEYYWIKAAGYAKDMSGYHNAHE